MSAPHADVGTAAKGLMKAWAFVKTGLPRTVLTLHEGRPLPKFPPEPHPSSAKTPEEWILVRVSHTGLNPAGLYQIRFIPACFRSKGSKSETIPEVDLAGTVLEVWHPSSADKAETEGEKGKEDKKNKAPATTSAPRFKKGDQIWASIDLPHTISSGCGALADHVAIPARFAVHRPSNVDPAHAAGLGMATFTAKTAVDTVAKAVDLSPGGRVLIVAAAGGIGSAAVQLVREVIGTEGFVVGVCRGEKADAVIGLGADDVVDYTAFESLPAELARRYGDQPFDAVIDCIGLQNVYLKSASFLEKGGVYAAVNMLAKDFTLGATLRAVSKAVLNVMRPTAPWLGGTGRKFLLINMKYPTTEEMEGIIAKVADGRLKVLIDSVWSYREVLKGYDVLESRRAAGKIIVKWDDEKE